MDARPKTRQVDRERKTPSTQVPRGAKQIVIPMTQQQYDDIWHDADRVRSFIEQCARSAPELFPAGFDQGYCLHGFGRESLKLSGLKLRKIVLANGASYWLRPSFIFSYMTGTADELAYPLLLAAHGVPFWLLTLGFGHNDMFWYRLIERLGRNSLVGTTVHDPAQLPSHLAADEHHADWAGQKGYVATTVGEGCVLGVGLTASADDAHLEEAYGLTSHACIQSPGHSQDGPSNHAPTRSVCTAAAVASLRARFSHSCGINLSLASLGRCARTCERYHGLFSPGSRPTGSSQTLSASPTGLRARWACGLMVLGATKC